MSGFKINFQLRELDKIVPWGQAPDLRLHWFGLTDGFLWLDAGAQTIYEYNEAAKEYFGSSLRYNDYQISRFSEDFFGMFRFVGEAVPKELYDRLDRFDTELEKWQECHSDEEDAVYEQFYFDEYCGLGQWRWDRTLDSGHLVGGPYIGFFRCGERLKILWESTFRLENGDSIWTAPKGSFELSYDEFVSAVTEFFHSFFAAMEQQVEAAVAKEWGSVSLDKQRLLKEHEERKAGFAKDLSFLVSPRENTDWDKVRSLCSKMEEEIKAPDEGIEKIDKEVV